MPEENREQLGDGRDDYVLAAQQISNVVKGVADSSAAVLKAGVEGGKAVSGIAAGTAAAGPWGAILSAAWAMRNGLFKVLVCICLVLLIFVIAIISLPSIVMNSIFGLDGNPGADGTTLMATYNEMSGVVPFGEQTVIGYLYAKEAELTAARTIMSGRMAGLDADTIRSRLRAAYV